MQIPKGAAVGIVVSRSWANLCGVRLFLRQHRDPLEEIKGNDDSHLVFAQVFDGDDPRGLWIQLDPPRIKTDAPPDNYRLMVPWMHIYAIAMGEKFSAVREEARRIGFITETVEE